MNTHEIIELVKKELLEKNYSYISNISSLNPFQELNPLTITDFTSELEKYNVTVDNSYIESIIKQINKELEEHLFRKMENNIFNDITKSTTGEIETFTIESFAQKYGSILRQDKNEELIKNINRSILIENKKRKRQQNYLRLVQCFTELADTDIKKDAIKQIMIDGEYNGFVFDTKISNKAYDDKVEMQRRVKYAELVILNEELFFYLANNGLNIFHGTNDKALESILTNGLSSSSGLNEKGIKLVTGEEYENNKKNIYRGGERNFISLTDELIVAAHYSYLSDNIPIIFCFNGQDFKQKYKDSLCSNVYSEMAEIGIVNSTIDPSDIKCIITSYDKLDDIKSRVSKYGIDVLGYKGSDNFNRHSRNKEGKFYDIYGLNVEIDEQEFEKVKKSQKIEKSNIENIVSMLTEGYDKGMSFIPITVIELITKYRFTEEAAQRIVPQINRKVEEYIRRKENNYSGIGHR